MSIPDDYRLPTDVKPTHYDLTIQTDLQAHIFRGVVKIDLDVVTRTSSIVLHTSHLQLGNAFLSTQKSSRVELGTPLIEEQKERITFELSNALESGSTAQLSLHFSGELTGNMEGYYKSSYVHDGETKFYSLTHFESTAARRAFPCWDEPLLKATFNVTMISREDTIDIANMPVKSESDMNHDISFHLAADLGDIFTSTRNGGWKMTSFETTPPMSTYLVAFANGAFDWRETSVWLPVSEKTIPLRIYATPDIIKHAWFALNIKKNVLVLCEKRLNIKYPLPKLDTLIASDFEIGGMENWGLITGRATALAFNPDIDDVQAMKRVASIQSHEVTHMWFGNITTMVWWNNLYLKEGFATLMGEAIILDDIYREWRVRAQFITTHLTRAMNLDSKLSSHPVEVDCPDASYIHQIFDALSYSKGASVLRMLCYHVGEDKFFEGVSIYLKKHLFGNTVTRDLWDAIAEATADPSIPDFMENWITRVGFPILTVEETEAGIKVRQNRFLETGPASVEEDETIWHVPLSIVRSEKEVINIVLNKREDEFELDTAVPFKLNSGTHGFYRVLYSTEQLQKIAFHAAQADTIFAPEDRMGLIYDAVVLSRAGFLNISGALDLINLLKKDQQYVVMDSIAVGINGLADVWWEDSSITDKLDLFIQELFVPWVKKFDYKYLEYESLEVRSFRVLAVKQALDAGNTDVIAALRKLFVERGNETSGEEEEEDDDDDENNEDEDNEDEGDEEKEKAETRGPHKPPRLVFTDLVPLIYTAVVKSGGRAEYRIIKEIYNDPKSSPSQRLSAIRALSASRNTELIQETLGLLTTARDQDIMVFFAALAANRTARRQLTQYLQREFHTLEQRFAGNSMLGSLVSAATSFYSSEDDLASVEAFFEDKDTSKYDMVLAQVLDGIRGRAIIVQRSTDDIKQWLSNKFP